MAKIEDNLIVDTEKIVGYAADISSDIDLVLSMTPKDGYQKKLELIVDAKDMSTKEKIEAIDAAESKYSQDLASNSEVYRDMLWTKVGVVLIFTAGIVLMLTSPDGKKIAKSILKTAA